MQIDNRALRSLWQEAFGDDDAFLDAFFRTAFSPERCNVLTDGSRLQAALYWFDCRCRGQKLAYIYAVATAKDLQGRGLCRSLMEDTHCRLQKDGYAGAILVPGEEALFRMYAAMGYEIFSTVREFSCTASGNSLPLRQIGREEYAHLRREFLPQDGVVQEGENLTFLETQCSFFAGENCLLAARREEGRLFCAELLGEAAPADILSTLQCSEGTFRAPGPGRPFAMYRSFNGEPASGYFGLAFD